MRASTIAIAVSALGVAACGLVPTGLAPARNAAPGIEGVPIPTSGEDPSIPRLPGYQLAWSDEFDGTALDATKWNVNVGPRHDAVMTTDAAVVNGGELEILTYTDATGHHTGFLDTIGKYEAQYGYYEARIRFWTEPGEWCAFWNLSPTFGDPIGDPGTAGTEIDIEHRAVDDAGVNIEDMVYVGINWDGYGAYAKRKHVLVGATSLGPLRGAWHHYAWLWTETGYVFYVDEVPLWSFSEAVSHHPHTVYLSCEVANATWAGSIPPGGFGPRDLSHPAMEVDWVRVWQKAP